jgi:hypothetical protein
MDIYGHTNGHVVERLFRQKRGGITKQEKVLLETISPAVLAALRQQRGARN